MQGRVLSVNLLDVCWTAAMSWFSHRRRISAAAANGENQDMGQGVRGSKRHQA